MPCGLTEPLMRVPVHRDARYATPMADGLQGQTLLYCNQGMPLLRAQKLNHLLGMESPCATNLEGQLAKHFEGAKEKPDHMVEQSRDEYRRCTVACDSVVDSLRFATPTYANGTLVLGSANHTAIPHNS